MELSILLLLFYGLNILCSFLVLKINIKYQIATNQRKIKFISEKTTQMQDEKINKSKLNDFCKVYAFLVKKYTLIGLLLTRKPSHSIVILFSFIVSYFIANFGIHYAVSASFPLLSSLISIAVQYEYYKCIFMRNQLENIDKIGKLISSNKVAIIVYTFMIISSLTVLLFLVYSVLTTLSNDQIVEILIQNGFILGLDSFIYKPLTFILAATIPTQCPWFLQMINQDDALQSLQTNKQQLELKRVINFSQQKLNDFIKDGDYQSKEIKNIFVSSIYNKKHNYQNQFVKSKSIQNISNRKQFFYLPEDKSNSGVKKEQCSLKRQKKPHFFAINQLQMNTQQQLDYENQTKSVEQILCSKVTNTKFYQAADRGKNSNSYQETKTLGFFINGDRNPQMFTDHTQNTLSDSYIQKSKKQQDQKSKFSKLDKEGINQVRLMKVQQVQTEMQEDYKQQQQLKECSTNTVHRYLRARKRRPTALHSQIYQQNLINIYLEGSKKEIKGFKPRRRQSQVGLQMGKRNRTCKQINTRSKPIVHQSLQKPNFFKLSDL